MNLPSHDHVTCLGIQAATELAEARDHLDHVRRLTQQLNDRPEDRP